VLAACGRVAGVLGASVAVVASPRGKPANSRDAGAELARVEHGAAAVVAALDDRLELNGLGLAARAAA
jgi:hypothetical protein